jgi:iron-sulfur cluster repair protein YtfE (RIC family)
MLTQLTLRIPVLFKSLFDRKLTVTDVLIQDHLKVEGLFLQFRLLSQLSERFPSRKHELNKRREDVFARIRKDLEKHMTAEEKVFYPACEKHEEVRAIALEAYEEHDQAKRLLKDLGQLEVSSESFEAKFTLLIEDVLHHVREEEESLFPRVRRIFSHSLRMKLAGQIRAAKKQTRRGKSAAAAA